MHTIYAAQVHAKQRTHHTRRCQPHKVTAGNLTFARVCRQAKWRSSWGVSRPKCQLMDSLLNRLATLSAVAAFVAHATASVPARLDAHRCVSTPLRLHSGHWIPDCQEPSSAEVARCFVGNFTANYFIPSLWFVPPLLSLPLPPPVLPSPSPSPSIPQLQH